MSNKMAKNVLKSSQKKKQNEEDACEEREARKRQNEDEVREKKKNEEKVCEERGARKRLNDASEETGAKKVKRSDTLVVEDDSDLEVEEEQSTEILNESGFVDLQKLKNCTLKYVPEMNVFGRIAKMVYNPNITNTLGKQTLYFVLESETKETLKVVVWESNIQKFLENTPKIMDSVQVYGINLKMDDDQNKQYNCGSVPFVGTYSSKSKIELIQSPLILKDDWIKSNELDGKNGQIVSVKGVVIEKVNSEGSNYIKLAQNKNRIKIMYLADELDALVIGQKYGFIGVKVTSGQKVWYSEYSNFVKINIA